MTDLSPVNGILNSKGLVKTALREASAKTGVGFDVLYNMAVRESSLDPAAKAKTSSAAGLFQFIESTWLGTVKEYGARHGMADFAKDIVDNGKGRFTVADPVRRKEILDLRFEPQKAAALAGELTNQNKRALENGLGRAVDGGELYAAHFLGAGGAKKILSAEHNVLAADLLPAAAKANRPVFYDGGRPKTVGEVIDGFRKSMNAELRETKNAIQPLPSTPFVAPSTAASIAPLNYGQTYQPGTANFNPSNIGAVVTPTGSNSVDSLALIILQALDPTALRTADLFNSRNDDEKRLR